jgi:hypothetical protein
MRVINFLAVVVGVLALGVSTLRVAKHPNPAVMKLPLHKKARRRHDAPFESTRKRQGTVETPDINYQTELLYIVELLIGTPPQPMYVQLDTGSSDLVVETDVSDICSTAPPNPCTNFGACKSSVSMWKQIANSCQMMRTVPQHTHMSTATFRLLTEAAMELQETGSRIT